MNNVELTTIIVKVIFAVITVALTTYVIPFLDALTVNYKDEKLTRFLRDAVKAAEQTVKGSGKGSEKKEKVINLASDWLKKYNIELSEEELSNMIESLVFSMNHSEESV